MKYYLGIDGGGTKTQCLLTDERGHDEDVFYTGSTNHHNTGPDPVRHTIEDIFIHYKNILSSLAGVCFAGAGVDVTQDVALYQELFSVPALQAPLSICSDALAALAGANGGLSGGVIIGGTGSIAVGAGPEDTYFRVGGFGHKVDDGGSGYAIARDGLRAALLSSDGRGPQTAILPRLMEKLGIVSPLAIVDYLYDGATRPQDIAALSPCVTQLAGQDAVADRILKNAVDELLLLVQGLVIRLGREDFSLGLAGGLLTHTPALYEPLLERIRLRYPAIRPHLPLQDPAHGAVLLARLQPGNILL